MLAALAVTSSGAGFLGVWSTAGPAEASTSAAASQDQASQSTNTTQTCPILCSPTTTMPPTTTTVASPPTTTRSRSTNSPPPASIPPVKTPQGNPGTGNPGTGNPGQANPGPAGNTLSPAQPPPPTVPSGGTGDNPVANAPFPAALQAIANSVHRSPPSNTSALIAALAPLEQAGMTPLQAEVAGMGQFPVAGDVYYTDDWLEPRPGPVPHVHMGDDIIAASGTPLRAPATGQLTYSNSDPNGYGLTALVTQPDATYYLMAHMSATVQGLTSGSAVTQGQIVGFVGATGDATGPHSHFEVHPQGGAGVDPKPILDQWQAQAIAAIPAVLAAYKGGTIPAPAVGQPVIPAPAQLTPGPSEYPTENPTLALGSGPQQKESLAAAHAPSVPASTRLGLAGLVLLLGTGAATLDVTWRARRARESR